MHQPCHSLPPSTKPLKTNNLKQTPTLHSSSKCAINDTSCLFSETFLPIRTGAQIAWPQWHTFWSRFVADDHDLFSIPLRDMPAPRRLCFIAKVAEHQRGYPGTRASHLESKPTTSPHTTATSSVCNEFRRAQSAPPAPRFIILTTSPPGMRQPFEPVYALAPFFFFAFRFSISTIIEKPIAK